LPDFNCCGRLFLGNQHNSEFSHCCLRLFPCVPPRIALSVFRRYSELANSNEIGQVSNSRSALRVVSCSLALSELSMLIAI
jgi:hypothetical protein